MMQNHRYAPEVRHPGVIGVPSYPPPNPLATRVEYLERRVESLVVLAFRARQEHERNHLELMERLRRIQRQNDVILSSVRTLMLRTPEKP